MALTFCDGFDSYAATSDMLKKWTQVTAPWAWNATAGPDGGPCAIATSNNGAPLASPAGAMPGTRFCLGFWLKLSNLLTSQDFMVWRTATDISVFYFRMTVGGAPSLWNRSANEYILGVRNIADNQWHWIELDINTINSSIMKMYVDGVKEFDGVQKGPMNSTILDRFAFLAISGCTVSVANVMVWSDVGSGFTTANFPVGPRDISTIRPDSDGTVTFSRSTGSSSFALVDEVNGDVSDYVESATPGAQDLYGYGALGFTPANINTVMLNSFAHNPLAGAINCQGVCKSGATTSTGTSILTPSVTPRTLQQPFDLDPNGNIPWTQANLDAAQFGIKVV